MGLNFLRIHFTIGMGIVNGGRGEFLRSREKKVFCSGESEMSWKKMCATGELVNLGGEKSEKIC